MTGFLEAALRPPALRDYEALTSWVPDAVACARWAGPGLRFPFGAKELPDLLAEPRSRSVCLGEPGGAALAFGQYWGKTNGAVHLGRIIVAPQARGRGVGRRFCELLIAAALEDTAAAVVTLRVYRDNAVALRLYSGLGFVPVDAEATADTLLMRQVARRL
jgi:ribosomal-protein-alanine N-acetyltransferase